MALTTLRSGLARASAGARPKTGGGGAALPALLQRPPHRSTRRAPCVTTTLAVAASEESLSAAAPAAPPRSEAGPQLQEPAAEPTGTRAAPRALCRPSGRRNGLQASSIIDRGCRHRQTAAQLHVSQTPAGRRRSALFRNGAAPRPTTCPTIKTGPVHVRKTRLICTIGPACASEEALEALARGGMDVARLARLGALASPLPEGGRLCSLCDSLFVASNIVEDGRAAAAGRVRPPSRVHHVAPLIAASPPQPPNQTPSKSRTSRTRTTRGTRPSSPACAS